jgi:hypothetical protein
MKLRRLSRIVILLSFISGIILTGCEKDTDFTMQKKNEQLPKIQAGGPGRINQTPVRLNTKIKSGVILMEHETKKGIIQNIR